MFFKRFISAILIGASLLTAVSCSQNPLDETALGGESLTPDGSEIETLETLIDTYTTMLNTHTVSLSEKDIELYKNSYDILYNRITDRGYAITSLTGTYVGMFTRDSAIQAMAHLAYGDSDSARAILRYLLSYHATLGLKRGTHIIDNVKDEEYRNNYLNTTTSSDKSYYEEQLTSGQAQFLINAPNNASATPFVTKKRSVDLVQAYLEGTKGARVVAEIYSDLMDKDTLVARGSYTFESATAGWKSIPLESTVELTPSDTYYLKLYTPEGDGRVVWYGITQSSAGYQKAWNYDLNAYGGNGWREVGVYTAFIIGESDTQTTFKYNISQKNSDTDLYIINAPNNQASQPFIPKNNVIRSVSVNLSKSSNKDTVIARICTDYKDPSTCIAEATYTFANNPNGWQNIVFENPVQVTPGQKYYLVLQATTDSGKVVWKGSTSSGGSLQSYNYDLGAFGGWEAKPYYPAYEIISYSSETLSKGFEARGNAAAGVELTVYSWGAKGKIRAEIRTDYTDPDSCIAVCEEDITKLGEYTYRLKFENAAELDYKGYYYLVITLQDTDGSAVLMSDSTVASNTYSLENNSWERVGYDLIANVEFNVDKNPIITLSEGVKATQEIPQSSQIITSVKVILSKDSKATGKVKASLYKGVGDNAKLIDTKRIDISQISENGDWVSFKFDLPLFKPDKNGNYSIVLETENATGNVYWCGSENIDNYRTFTESNGVQKTVSGEASFEALRSEIKLISDYTQTDANYMLIHAWVMYVNSNGGSEEDLLFIQQSYPIIKSFANYYIDNAQYYNKKMDLIFNPSLEHSRKIRYWQSYDLLTNVFASQALYELSGVATQMKDDTMSEKWMKYAKQIENGINTHLVTEYDGKKIYGEFYDVEDNMKFYAGISWVNLAPVAAEWYGMDIEIMKNTYEVYKKYASVSMYGSKCLATEATLGTNELTRELIGKGIAWELMLCDMIGDTQRIEQIVALEVETAKRNNIKVYPEFWKSESYVTDPGNQEHCSWQFYAMSKVFPELVKSSDE